MLKVDCPKTDHEIRPWIIASTDNVIEYAKKELLKEASTSKMKRFKYCKMIGTNWSLVILKESKEPDEETYGSEADYVVLN